MSQTACAAPPQRLRRLLLLSDVYGWTLALLTLLLCLLILPLPLLGVRTLLLMPVSFLALLPVLYAYRGLTIRSVAPLPKVSASSRLALLRTHLCSVTALHAVGCLLFVLASVGAAIAIVLPLLSPCAEAVEPDGLTARAVLACCWALAAGAVPAMRACASPTFARLPWHDAASPAALRLRARLVRLAPEALRASTVLFAVGLALSPAVLALARPRFDGTALLLVDGCRAFPLTRGAVGPPPSTGGEEDDPTPSPSGATPAELATFALLRQLSLRSYLRMLLSAAWFHFLLHAALALVRLAYGRRISLACPPSVSRQSSSSAPLPRSAASGAATAAGTIVGSFGPPVAAPRSAAALGGEGEGLLLRALLTDEAPLTQHLAFLELAHIAESQPARRAALLGGGGATPGWKEILAAARRPIDSLSEAIGAASKLKPPPSAATGGLVRRARAVRGSLERHALGEALFGSAEAVAWAATALSRIAAASRTEDARGLVQLSSGVQELLLLLLRCSHALDTLLGHGHPHLAAASAADPSSKPAFASLRPTVQRGTAATALAVAPLASAAVTARTSAHASRLDAALHRAIALLLCTFGERLGDLQPPAELRAKLHLMRMGIA